MNIAIIGNGKMGKIISKIAKERNHIITITTSSKNPANNIDFKNIDVAIDFSTPNTAFENISHAIKNNIPVISGTTGWTNKLDEIHSLCKNHNGAFLHSPNFSIGVNLFFKLNIELAELMKKQNYSIQIHEVHHTEKIDSPSGTAKRIKKDIQKVKNCTEKITSERIENIIGVHKVKYTSEFDEIEIKHSAKNRNGFALGAIMAAEWIINKKGVFEIIDVLNDVKL